MCLRSDVKGYAACSDSIHSWVCNRREYTFGGYPMKDLVEPLEPIDPLCIGQRVIGPDHVSNDGQLVGQHIIKVQPLLLDRPPIRSA
jgi:hypothetical protein